MDYSQYKIKDYQYWEVNIHENQGYLGRCVIWCKRADATDLSEATPEEYQELLQVIKEIKDALTKVFQPDWFNYALLGNEIRHLHCHLIPRHTAPKTFEGIQFEDKLYGHNYKTDHDFKVSEEVIQEIKEAIIRSL